VNWLRRWREALRASLLWPMVRKEFIQMRRDPATLAMLLGVPAIQLLLFGFAVRTEVRHLPTVVLDQSHSPESRRLTATLEQTGNFRMIGTVTDRVELTGAIEKGRARAGLVIPPDFSRHIARADGATAQLIVDASDPLSSSAAIGGAGLVSRVLPGQLQPSPGAAVPLVDLRVRPWYNPALRSSTFIVPGVVGMLLTITFLMVMAAAVVREREAGTLEQLVVTPISKSAILLGKVIPFVVIAYVQMTNVLVLGWLVFRVPMRGSLPLLYALAGLFILATLGLGLLIATTARTQASAQQMALLFTMPAILLSGYIFPREAMPAIAQWIGLLLPITWFLEILRGILLKGAGLAALWRPTIALLVMTLVLLTVAIRRFAKTVE
jgi:ABC-2 type transport system permease protein